VENWKIHKLTEKGNWWTVQCLPASATPAHLHPVDQESAQGIPSRVCHHSAEEIRPKSDAAVSEQCDAAVSVLSAPMVTSSHTVLKTTCDDRMH